MTIPAKDFVSFILHTLTDIDFDDKNKMNAAMNSSLPPIVRKNLNFHLNEVPRFWFDNDPFKTRLFDALSLTFPDGERYFIQCGRLFQDQIQEPELA